MIDTFLFFASSLTSGTKWLEASGTSTLEDEGAKGNGDVARHAASGDHQLPRHADRSLIGRLAAALEEGCGAGGVQCA